MEQNKKNSEVELQIELILASNNRKRLTFNNRKKAEELKIINNTLILASANGNIEIVRQSVEQGANIHVYNDRPLELATRKGHTEVINYLTKNG